MNKKLLIIASLLSLSATSAFAATTTYTDFTSWTDDVAGVITTETYNGYDFTAGGDNVVNYGSSVTLGGLTYSTSSGAFFYGINKNWSFDATYLKSNYLSWQSTNNSNSLTIALPSYVKAIAFNFGGYFGDALAISIKLGNNDSYTATGTSNAFSFIGAISDTPFNKLTISAPNIPISASNFPTLDNFSTASVVAVVVPEPTAYGMMLVGLGLIGLARRRNK